MWFDGGSLSYFWLVSYEFHQFCENTFVLVCLLQKKQKSSVFLGFYHKKFVKTRIMKELKMYQVRKTNRTEFDLHSLSSIEKSLLCDPKTEKVIKLQTIQSFYQDTVSFNPSNKSPLNIFWVEILNKRPERQRFKH